MIELGFELSIEAGRKRDERGRGADGLSYVATHRRRREYQPCAG